MRIISKYKDFYDFYNTDYSNDLVYVRQLEIISSKEIYEYLSKKYKFLDIYNLYNSEYSSHIKNTIILDNFIYGIYPYIYIQPYFRWYDDNLDCYIYVLNNDEYKSIINYKTREHNINNILSNKIKDIKNYKKSYIPKYKEYYNKIEDKEIFLKLDCPVFCIYNNYLLNDDKSDFNKYKIIKNPCFNKFNINIIRCFHDDIYNLNTYINIENFLWASKVEPISNPDNNTKIINHGFDLKESFRNIK